MLDVSQARGLWGASSFTSAKLNVALQVCINTVERVCITNISYSKLLDVANISCNKL